MLNTIFVILTLVIAIALIVYLVGVKKEKSQKPPETTPTEGTLPPKEKDETEL